MLIFILLEIVCIILLAQSQPYHSRVIVNASSDFTGACFNITTNISNYFSLGTENEKLTQENSKLLNLVQFLKSENDSIPQKPSDTVFNFIPAKVVSNSTHLNNNYIVIDKGSADGISKDMGLISSDGIAGIITSVSKHYATAISMLHKFSSISVHFKNSNHLASLIWEGNNYRYGTIEHIPTHLNLQKGDTVLTSGYSFIFPEGIMVGTVEELFESPSGDLNSASVCFATNFNTLRHVYIIQNNHRAELDSLVNQNINEE